MKRQLKRILYIEDDEDIRTLAQIALEDIGGFVVKFCATSSEGLAQAESFKPDLFLLDIIIPELDGPATLQELHKLPSIKNVPAIFMTAMQKEEETRFKKLGAINVIVKPFNPMTLADTIRKYWSNYHEE